MKVNKVWCLEEYKALEKMEAELSSRRRRLEKAVEKIANKLDDKSTGTKKFEVSDGQHTYRFSVVERTKVETSLEVLKDTFGKKSDKFKTQEVKVDTGALSRHWGSLKLRTKDELSEFVSFREKADLDKLEAAYKSGEITKKQFLAATKEEKSGYIKISKLQGKG